MLQFPVALSDIKMLWTFI